MSKKFTEEQYQEIIKVWRNEAGYVKGMQAVVDYLSSIDMSFMVGEAVALANPTTREWAHEQYVEKEKRYIWHLKTDKKYRLTTHAGATQVNISHSSESKLTESEIKAWGFNQEMFDKEEVD